MPIDPKMFAAFYETGIPFNAFLGLRVEHFAVGHAIIRMPYRDELLGDADRPALHGGALAALIDAAAGAAALSNVEAVDRVSTLDLRIDYLRPAPKADLIARADVRRMGGRIAVVNVVVSPVVEQGEVGEPVAEGRGVFSVRRGKVAAPVAASSGDEPP